MPCQRFGSIVLINYSFPIFCLDCEEVFTLRYEQALIGHLRDTHPNLSNRTVKRRAWEFRRTANLEPRIGRSLPNLPDHPVSSLDLLGRMVPVRQNAHARLEVFTESQTTAPPSQGHRRGRLETRGQERNSDHQGHDELDCPDIFQDMPQRKRRKVEEPQAIVISPGLFQLQAQNQLSIPPPAKLDPEVGVGRAPDSFGYDYMQGILNA